MKAVLPAIFLTSFFSLVLQADDKLSQPFESQPVLYARLERPTGTTLGRGDVIKEPSGSSRSVQPIPFRYAVASTEEGMKARTAKDLFIGKANHQLFWRGPDRGPAGARNMSFKKLFTGSVCDFRKTNLGITEMNTGEYQPSRLDTRYEPPFCLMFFLHAKL